jgi:hypothetical protein
MARAKQRRQTFISRCRMQNSVGILSSVDAGCKTVSADFHQSMPGVKRRRHTFISRCRMQNGVGELSEPLCRVIFLAYNNLFLINFVLQITCC